ncbi:pyroglutamyl-peptidase I [Aerococcaceae bacterium DSM 109653]|uniref:Pyrrolidone-carboxylate peptidase n=1 Tax=Fundicoccus ignavus TaxID=2664442 RepID=A0A6I2GWL8_9LACT|nr:pyroglutamyl-peptidase I [Fundicoccus ignavus]MRI80483.1 pyroglutamyl-peptidase I [Fundicoccus ignavus]MRI84733.1 pyroglutamyl-peptidase I [Fundicoccus ignavus]
MKILVTGFDPFGQDTINPALEAVKQLPNEILGASIIKLEIPTMFHQSANVVNLAIQQHQPDIVVHIGQAGGRFGITPERIAINLDDARIADNSSQQPIDQLIAENGPAAYFSQLPVKAMVANMQEVGIPATVSNSAGTFVCNHIMYQTLHYCQMNYPQIQSGFIHVPYLPQQVADKASLPSMDLKTIVQGLVISIETIITYQGHADIKTVGGSLH